MPMRRWAQLQGGYFLLSGIWPFLSPGTFQRVLGFKRDLWLADVVGALLAVSGALLIGAARRGRLTPEIRLLGLLQATVLLGADLAAVHQPDATLNYLWDAGVEAIWMLGWVASAGPGKRGLNDLE